MFNSLIALVLAVVPAPVNVNIVKITDGDTAVADNGSLQAPVRVVCIDAPETPRTPQEVARQDAVAITQFKFGKLAKSRIEQLNRESGGKAAIARLAVDQYGRNLASVQFPQGDWGETLLKEGLAVVYAPNPKQCDLVKLQNLEAVAKEQKLGVWGVTDGSWIAPSAFRKTLK